LKHFLGVGLLCFQPLDSKVEFQAAIELLSLCCLGAQRGEIMLEPGLGLQPCMQRYPPVGRTSGAANAPVIRAASNAATRSIHPETGGQTGRFPLSYAESPRASLRRWSP